MFPIGAIFFATQQFEQDVAQQDPQPPLDLEPEALPLAMPWPRSGVTPEARMNIFQILETSSLPQCSQLHSELSFMERSIEKTSRHF